MTGPRPSDTSDPLHLLDTPDAGPAAIRGGAIRVAGYGAGIVITAMSAALLFRHPGKRQPVVGKRLP